MRTFIQISLLCLASVLSAIPATASDTTLVKSVASSGAIQLAGGSYHLKSTLRQTAISRSLGGTLVLNHGYWPNEQYCCIGMRGNVDGDPNEQVTVSDLNYLAGHLFQGGRAPSCTEEADIDGDGDILVSDVTYLTAYLFQSGSAPANCPGH